ncbi:Serine peptidase inhibitor [Mactra antiquata]
MIGSVTLLGFTLTLATTFASTDVCYQPKKSGPCEALLERYFYNTETCRCENFYWGGCEANGNMFDNLTECRNTCETPLKISNNICTQPKKPGPCKAYMPRWWFNSSSCSCEQFVYGGCGANDNNFMSESDCQASCKCRDCVCDLPIKPYGDGEIRCLAHILSYGFNNVTCQCEDFFYSGCGGNANRFPTREECEARCDDTCSTQTCELPIDPGPCQSLVPIPRYYYDKDTCQCKKFYYGGCEGNSNNFETTEECLNACGGYEVVTMNTINAIYRRSPVRVML